MTFLIAEIQIRSSCFGEDFLVLHVGVAGGVPGSFSCQIESAEDGPYRIERAGAAVLEYVLARPMMADSVLAA